LYTKPDRTQEVGMTTEHSLPTGPFPLLIEQFANAMKAVGLSPETITIYCEDILALNKRLLTQ
jgi:hypothetical protein